ncbi:hypothetical protein ZWY2020_016867 [Hordeum vulgare]|nr:hypothetical protein ZWY2020_016867 [Hordeum vulgare]
MATANLSNVAVAIDSSKESMKELRWALDSLRLRPDGALIVLHVQPPPGIAADLNPASIPFGSRTHSARSTLSASATRLGSSICASKSCPDVRCPFNGSR